MKRTIQILKILIGLMLLLACAIYLLVSTQAGTSLLLTKLQKYAPGSLQIETIQGSLNKQVSLRNLSYQYQNFKLKIDTADLALNLRDLLQLKIGVRSLVLKGSQIHIANQKTVKEKSNNATNYFAWTNYVNLQNVHSKDLTLFINTHKTTFNNIELKNIKNRYEVSLDSEAATGKLLIQLPTLFSDQFETNWKLHIENLNRLYPAVSGTLETNGTISSNQDKLKISAILSGGPFSYDQIHIGGLNGKIETVNNIISSQMEIKAFQHDNLTLNLIKLQANSNIVKNKLISQINLLMDNETAMRGKLTLPFPLDAQSDIAGMIQLTLNDLSVISTSLYQIHQGKLNGDLKISGSMNSPIIEAQLGIRSNEVVIPETGTQLKNILLNVQYANNTAGKLSGTLLAGDGKASIDGTFDFNNNNELFKINIKGEQLTAVNLPEYLIKASPDLRIFYQEDIVRIKGAVKIDSAKIEPVNFANSVKPSADVVYIRNNKVIEDEDAANFALDLQITLSDKIALNYDKLSTELTGGLHLNKKPLGPITATGELQTKNGIYNAYTNQLKIESGRIIYSGNLLKNPGLDIRAVKSVQAVKMDENKSILNKNELKSSYAGEENILVGVLVNGTLDNPIVKLISDPPGLDQSDILSYLLFGNPKSQINSSSSLTILNSVLASNNQDLDFNKKLQKVLGLSELNINQTEYFDPNANTSASATTLAIGKKLGDRIYLRYRVGLFEPISILNLSYQISPNLKIQSETSTIDNGVDLLYEFETD